MSREIRRNKNTKDFTMCSRGPGKRDPRVWLGSSLSGRPMNTCTNAGQAPARTAAPMSVVENQVEDRPRPDERTARYYRLWPKSTSPYSLVSYLIGDVRELRLNLRQALRRLRRDRSLGPQPASGAGEATWPKRLRLLAHSQSLARFLAI